MQDRISKDEYYLKIAEAASLRSSCCRAKVGAVIVKGEHLFTGFNDSLPKFKHCTNDNSCLFKGHCIRTTHAEVNAIVRALKVINNLNGAKIYSTHKPCYSCTKMLAAFGIMDIVYVNDYDDEFSDAYINLVGMNVKKVYFSK